MPPCIMMITIIMSCQGNVPLDFLWMGFLCLSLYTSRVCYSTR